MKKRFLSQLLSCLTFVLLAGTVQASVLTNTVNFSDTQTTSGTGTIVHAGPSGLTGNFSPFNASLGTLDSFLIDWEVTVTSSGTTSPSAGNISELLNGVAYINLVSYNGKNNSNGIGGAPNSLLPARSASISIVDTFLVSNAGTDILSTVTGGSNFDLSYKAGGSNNTAKSDYVTMATVTSAMTGSVTLTYNYTPAVPEPSTYLLLTISLGVVGYVRKKMTHREEQTAV